MPRLRDMWTRPENVMVPPYKADTLPPAEQRFIRLGRVATMRMALWCQANPQESISANAIIYVRYPAGRSVEQDARGVWTRAKASPARPFSSIVDCSSDFVDLGPCEQVHIVAQVFVDTFSFIVPGASVGVLAELKAFLTQEPYVATWTSPSRRITGFGKGVVRFDIDENGDLTRRAIVVDRRQRVAVVELPLHPQEHCSLSVLKGLAQEVFFFPHRVGVNYLPPRGKTRVWCEYQLTEPVPPNPALPGMHTSAAR